MSKQQKTLHEAEMGYSKLIPEHQRNDYADLIDAFSIRVDSLNIAAMEFLHLEMAIRFLKDKLSTDEVPQNHESIATKNVGKTWQIHNQFYTSPRHGDLFLCSHDNDGKKEFAVIARLKPDSPGAKFSGEVILRVVGDGAGSTLDRFLKSEMQMILRLKNDYERGIARRLVDSFLDEDCRQIFASIEQERIAANRGIEQSVEALKRNGEHCQHKVPGFPGLLTTGEYTAYVDVLASVESELRYLKILETNFPTIEKMIPHWEKLAARLDEKDSPKSISSTTRRADQQMWQIYEVFSKPDLKCETLFCSRSANGKREFAIIEKMDLKGDGRWFGEGQIHALGEDAPRVIEEFFRREQASLHCRRQELKYVIEQNLSERLPPNQCARVLKAIAPIYDKGKFVVDEDAPSENISSGMKIKH
jgi:hypothetical protein